MADTEPIAEYRSLIDVDVPDLRDPATRVKRWLLANEPVSDVYGNPVHGERADGRGWQDATECYVGWRYGYLGPRHIRQHGKKGRPEGHDD